MTGPIGLPEGPKHWYQVPGAAVKLLVLWFVVAPVVAVRDAVKNTFKKEK